MEDREEKKEYNYDIYGLENRFSNFEKRINGSEMLQENKELAIAFKCKAYAESLMSKRRLLKYETFFRYLDQLLVKPYDQATRPDIQILVATVKDRKDWADATKSDFIKQLKRYYKIAAGMQDDDEYPDIVRGIKAPGVKYPEVNYDAVPNWGDIMKMADHTLKIRDRAMIKVLWESGARAGELLTLKVGSIDTVEHGVYMNIRESKTQLRPVFLRLSAPDLLQWLSTHPLGQDKEAPLFCKIEKGEYHKAISQRYLYKLNQILKERSGINKKLNPHQLRHGSASFFADFLSDSDMDQRFGWAQGSKIKGKYTHKNKKSVEGKILQMSGIGQNNDKVNPYEDAERKQVECYYCHKMNDPERKVCYNCFRIMNIYLAEKTQKLKEHLDDVGTQFIDKNPGVLKKFVDYLSGEAEKKIGGPKNG